MTTPWGGRVVYTETTASTMDDALVLEDRGEPDGSVAWTGFQTAGRGRHAGRTWAGEPGDSLLFTVFWHPQRFSDVHFAPSLVVGLGLCLWLGCLGADPARVRLKWPNDLYIDGRKAAGILVRRRVSASGPGTVHAGVGINLSHPPEASGFRTPAACVADLGLDLGPPEALATLLPRLAEALDHPNPRAACEAHLWRLGQEVSLSTPDGSGLARHGRILGLDEAGCLVWDRGSGPETVSSGE
jgi:BirA family biotin operon repressor/biotin-[acetyl-CoA-carboxylase] ligase